MNDEGELLKLFFKVFHNSSFIIHHFLLITPWPPEVQIDGV